MCPYVWIVFTTLLCVVQVTVALHRADFQSAPVIFERRARNLGYQNAGPTRLCTRPIEHPTFINCVPRGSDVFPATNASCECVHCSLSLQLVCQPDNRWYPERGAANPCDPRNSNKLCGSCSARSARSPLYECARSKDGYQGEKRKCTCLSTCEPFYLLCDKNGIWTEVSQHRCSEGFLPRRYLEREHLFETFQDGTFLYECSNGYRLRGPTRVKCDRGVMKGIHPSCIKMDAETTTIETITSTPILKTTQRPTTIINTIFLPSFRTIHPYNQRTTLITETTKMTTTQVPTTKVPTTQVPTTKVPTTQVPTTKVPTTQVPTTKTTKIPTTTIAPKNSTAINKIDLRIFGSEYEDTTELLSVSEFRHPDSIDDHPIEEPSTQWDSDAIFFPDLPSRNRPASNWPAYGNMPNVNLNRNRPERRPHSIKPAQNPFPVILVSIASVCVIFMIGSVVGLYFLSRRYKLVCEPGTKRFNTLIGCTMNVNDDFDEGRELQPIKNKHVP